MTRAASHGASDAWTGSELMRLPPAGMIPKGRSNERLPVLHPLARLQPNPRFPRKRSGFGNCVAPMAGPAPFWRTREAARVLVHETHGETCAAFKQCRPRAPGA